MNILPDHNAYYQGYDRPVIQIKTELRWIVWNWDTNTWDAKDHKVDRFGVPI